MYEITVEKGFTAAHRHALPGRGCPLHGHDFLVLVTVAGRELKDDVLVDFHDLETELARHVGELAHRDLGEHPDFRDREATPAALARWIHDRMAERFRSGGSKRIAAVEVRDGDRSGARYLPDPE